MNILIRTIDGQSFYARPDSTMIRALSDYYIPDEVAEVSAIPVLCFKSARSGKAVRERFAPRYIGPFSCGLLLKTVLSGLASEYRICMENSMDYTTIIPYDFIPIEELSAYISEKRPYVLSLNGHETTRIVSPPDIPMLSSAVSMITSYCSLRTGDFVGVELSEPVPLAKGHCITADFGVNGRIRIEIK